MKIIPPFLLVAVFFQLTTAFALPKFSLKEQKRCYACHYNRNGGGPLNRAGKYYSHKGSLKGYAESLQKYAQKKPKVYVAKKKKKHITKKKKVVRVEPTPIEKEPIVLVKREVVGPETLLDKTNLSANLVLSFLYSERTSDPQNFYLMQAEPLVTTQVTPNFLTVFGYNFAVPVLTAYGQIHDGPSYLQVGSFHIPFGVDFLDYNNVAATLIKENFDLALDTRDVGVEVGWKRDFYLRAAAVNRARAPRARPSASPIFDRNLGFVLDAGYEGLFFKIPFLLGTSALFERRIPPGLPVRGVPSNPLTGGSVQTMIWEAYGQFNYKNFGMLGEFAFSQDTPVENDQAFGFYLKPYLNMSDKLNVALRTELFGRDRHFLGDNTLRVVLSSNYKFSKYLSIEPMYRMNIENGNIAEAKNNDAIVLLSAKF